MSDGSYRPRFTRSLLAPRHGLTWLGIGLYWLLSYSPWQVRTRLGHWAGDLVYRLNARRGMLWWRSGARLDRMVSIEGLEHLQQCQAAGRPAILLTGHSVALDFGAAAITRRFATVGLIKPLRNPVIEWLMSRGRIRFKGRLYLRQDGLRPVIRALRQGRAFYYLPDEDLTHVKGSDWIFAPFFGVPAATITALGKLARLSGAAVIPCMTWYLPEEGRYRVSLSAPLKMFPSGDVEADTARMNAEIERMVRRHPEQYMWSLRLFKTRPGNAPSPYS